MHRGVGVVRVHKGDARVHAAARHHLGCVPRPSEAQPLQVGGVEDLQAVLGKKVRLAF